MDKLRKIKENKLKPKYLIYQITQPKILKKMKINKK